MVRRRNTVHADRGTSMTSKPVSALLTDLGVTRTHSRPHVSNDNPYSEAQYRTLKYLPDFPDHFVSLEHAKQFLVEFFYQRLGKVVHAVRRSSMGLLVSRP
jgi:putative transposase